MERTIKGNAAEKFAYAYGKAITSGKTMLYDYYKNPSQRKVSIDERIMRRALDKGYFGYAVIGGNAFNFTVAYRNDYELVVDTKENRYHIPISTDTILHYVNGDF